MKKFQKSLLIFMPFLLMNIYILIFLNYMMAQENTMYISNKLYSTWNIILDNDTLDIGEIIKEIPNGSRIFVEYENEGTFDIRSFYQKDNWVPPIISGRFLDVESREREAVVGIEVKEEIQSKDIININGITYKVVGIVGTTYGSSLDNIVLVNDMNIPLDTKRVIIDSSREKDLNEIDLVFNVKKVNENKSLDRINNMNFFNFLIKGNVIFVITILTFISGVIYFNLYKKLDKVLFLLGESKIKILCRNIINITLIFSMSFGCSIEIWT